LTDNVVKTYTFVHFHEFEHKMGQLPKADTSAVCAINRHLRIYYFIYLNSSLCVYRCGLASGTNSLLVGALSAFGASSLLTAGEKHVSRNCHMDYLMFERYKSRLLVLMISVIRATNVSRGVAPRFSFVRRRTATAFSDASLSPTTSM
jgi:hypothetical protein